MKIKARRYQTHDSDPVVEVTVTLNEGGELEYRALLTVQAAMQLATELMTVSMQELRRVDLEQQR